MIPEEVEFNAVTGLAWVSGRTLSVGRICSVEIEDIRIGAILGFAWKDRKQTTSFTLPLSDGSRIHSQDRDIGTAWTGFWSQL
jgi:hypothetical protein